MGTARRVSVTAQITRPSPESKWTTFFNIHIHLCLPLAKDPCTAPCFSGVEDVENGLLEIRTAASQTVKMTRRGQA